MTDHFRNALTRRSRSARASGTVTSLVTRRASSIDVLTSLTVYLGGVHYGTFPLRMSYERGKPIVLYVVPAGGGTFGDDIAGPVDCLLTDDENLGIGVEQARQSS